MVFLFPNLPIELSFMIEDYVLSYYKDSHKSKFATVLAEYKASNRIKVTMGLINCELTSKPCYNISQSNKYDWHYCLEK